MLLVPHGAVTKTIKGTLFRDVPHPGFVALPYRLTLLTPQAKVRALEAQLDSAGLGPSYGALPPLQLPARSSSPPLPGQQPQPSYASALPAVDSEPSSAWTPHGLGTVGTLAPASPLAASVSASGSIAAGRLAAYAYENGGAASPRVSVQLPNGVRGCKRPCP